MWPSIVYVMVMLTVPMEHDCHVCLFHGIRPYKSSDCFLLCKSPDCICLSHYLQCASGGCIPYTNICDGHRDCPDGTDEYMCAITLPESLEALHTVNGLDLTPDDAVGVCDRKEGKGFIELHELCNKKVDCYYGEDEGEVLDCSRLVVTHTLRCTRDNVFVSPMNIGFGGAQCPISLDDEVAAMCNRDLPEQA